MSEEYLKGELTISMGRSYSTKTKHRTPYLKFYREHILIARIFYHSTAKQYVIDTADNVSLTKATLKELMDFLNTTQFRTCRRWAESKINTWLKEAKAN